MVSPFKVDMELPLFDGFNYTLKRESLEISREFTDKANGKITAGWEMRVPSRGPDGVPYLMIFVGPTSRHRGSAIRLRMVTKDGHDLPDDANVLLESYHMSGAERQVIFQGSYKGFKDIPDQHAANAALAVQKRVESGEHYVIRLGVTLPDDCPMPDLLADDSYFEIECVKIWWSESA